MPSETRVAQLEALLTSCLRGDGTVAKGYGQRAAAIRAELDKLRAGDARQAVTAPTTPVAPSLVQRMAAAPPTGGPRVRFRPRAKP